MLNLAIVGAGAAGAAAARFAARAGHRVTLFEQFHVDHDRGSSYGPSRVIRRTYPDRLYTGLMHEAYQLWDDLEVEAATELRIRSGGIFFGPSGHPHLKDTLDAMDAHGLSYDLLGEAEAREIFPMFCFRPGDAVIYQDDTGILKASECVRAQVRIARGYGAVLREGAEVREIMPVEGGLRVSTEDGEGSAFDRVAIAAGPWMGRLLSDLALPLTPTLQQQIYVRPISRPGPSRFAVGRFPVWIDAAPTVAESDTATVRREPPAMYGFPAHPEAPGVKVALHAPGRIIDPAHRESDVDPDHVATLQRYLKDRIPDLGDGEVVASRTCIYTNTPDSDFVIDAVPGLPGAYFASACSGHGFKFSILVGKILTELLEGQGRHRDLARFQLTRFAGRMEHV